MTMEKNVSVTLQNPSLKAQMIQKLSFQLKCTIIVGKFQVS